MNMLAQRLAFRPCNPTIRAEVLGLDPDAIDDETAQQLREARLRREVPFLRDHADPEGCAALGCGRQGQWPHWRAELTRTPSR
jgi:alpha-ketoglutarate-dependent taurine dioxygenase